MSNIIREEFLFLPVEKIAKEFAYIKKALKLSDTEALSAAIHHVYTVLKQHDSIKGTPSDD